jgi:hypothetical protein
MNEKNIIKNLDILKNLLNIPKYIVPENCRQDEDDIYFFEQNTKEIFNIIIEDIKKSYCGKSYKTKIQIDNNKLHTLFENIKNPVLIYEFNDLLGDVKFRDEQTIIKTYLFMWDYEDEKKIFYLFDEYNCPYHIIESGYVWIQTYDSFLNECNGNIKNIINRFYKENFCDNRYYDPRYFKKIE